MSNRRSTRWSVECIDWLIREGRMATSVEQLLSGFCERVVETGVPLDRAAVFVWTLHPLYFGTRLLWDGDTVQTSEGEYSAMASEAYRQSPVVRIRHGESAIRRRLADPQCALDFAVLVELKDEGFADYLLMELVFSDGQRHGVSFATRDGAGFDNHDIAELKNVLNAFALALESRISHRLSQTLLHTYLGEKTGARVLDGTIRRGDGEEIDAVIWYSDLRDSTRLSTELEGDAFLRVLNDYFEATAGAVLEEGGEILRFIGDASLAVFPIGGDGGSAKDACESAVNAAYSAMARASAVNEQRVDDNDRRFDFGIGLHRGQVLYGNIGTPGRLEFSVIGPAANYAARVEALCKSTGATLLATNTVVEHVDRPWRSLGSYALRGLAGELEVHTPI